MAGNVTMVGLARPIPKPVGRVATSYRRYQGGNDNRLPPKSGDWQSEVLPQDSSRHSRGTRLAGEGPIAAGSGSGAVEGQSRRESQVLTGHGGQMDLLPVRDMPTPQDEDDLQPVVPDSS